jgi:hypothetical protein
MAEQTHTYHDPLFNLNQAYYYSLLIQVDAASFSYAITYKKQLMALQTNCSLSELTDPHELAELFDANYKKIVVGVPANGFTLLPSAIFNKEYITGYARLLDVKPTEKVLAQRLDVDNHIIYKVDDSVITAVHKFDLDNVVYLNQGWITAVAQNNPQNTDLHLHTENGKAAFLYFNDGKIRFYNTFEFKSEDDLAYYASFVAQELELTPNHIYLKLSGSIEPNDNYGRRLSSFFPDVVWNDLQILELPDEIPAQQIMTLAALSLCGSSEEY